MVPGFKDAASLVDALERGRGTDRQCGVLRECERKKGYKPGDGAHLVGDGPMERDPQRQADRGGMSSRSVRPTVT